jgi:hypothetical protein
LKKAAYLARKEKKASGSEYKKQVKKRQHENVKDKWQRIQKASQEKASKKKSNRIQRASRDKKKTMLKTNQSKTKDKAR